MEKKGREVKGEKKRKRKEEERGKGKSVHRWPVGLARYVF